MLKLLVIVGAVGAIAVALAVPGPRESAPPAAGRVITMGHESFGRSVVTIRAGDRLTFSNTSSWLHVLVPGKGARQDSQTGLPRFGARNAHLSEHGDRWLTAAWNTPGVFFITCQLHREMTLEVKVVSSRPTHARTQRSGRPNA